LCVGGVHHWFLYFLVLCAIIILLAFIMRKKFVLIIFSVLIVVVLSVIAFLFTRFSVRDGQTPTPTATSPPTGTPAPTSSLAPSSTPNPTPTSTISPNPDSSPTPTPTNRPTPTPTSTPTPTLTPTPNPTPTPTPKPTPSPTPTPLVDQCIADDSSTLSACSSKLASGAVDVIQISGVITCTASKPCPLVLNNINRPVLIYGLGSNSGFRRTGGYTYPVIKITNSVSITLANLVVDEDSTKVCDKCVSSIHVTNSTNLVFDRVSVLDSKEMGIVLVGVRNFVLKNSFIHSSGVFGVWFAPGADYNRNILFDNNLFTDVTSNAIFLNAIRDNGVQPNIIRDTTFIHNHHIAIFESDLCGGPCPGGQLYISDSKNFRIERNIIRDGKIDAGNTQGDTTGIEMARLPAGTSVDDITFSTNKIYNNAGAGISVNPNAVVDNILIKGDVLYDNLFPFFGFEGKDVTTQDNCFEPSCPIDSSIGYNLPPAYSPPF